MAQFDQARHRRYHDVFHATASGVLKSLNQRFEEYVGWADEGGPTIAALSIHGDLVGPRKLGPIYMLNHIHEHQVMHNHVNNGSILVARNDLPGSQGGAYLIDFGLASVVHQASPSLLAADDTLSYVLPEQTGHVNGQVDNRTDLYSLGLVLQARLY